MDYTTIGIIVVIAIIAAALIKRGNKLDNSSNGGKGLEGKLKDRRDEK